jgi:hypothetical protein
MVQIRTIQQAIDRLIAIGALERPKLTTRERLISLTRDAMSAAASCPGEGHDHMVRVLRRQLPSVAAAQLAALLVDLAADRLDSARGLALDPAEIADRCPLIRRANLLAEIRAIREQRDSAGADLLARERQAAAPGIHRRIERYARQDAITPEGIAIQLPQTFRGGAVDRAATTGSRGELRTVAVREIGGRGALPKATTGPARRAARKADAIRRKQARTARGMGRVR